MYETKDSGQHEEFSTGARRDTEVGKGRFDLIPFYPLLRLAQLYERGAEKYAPRNWQKGIPLERYLSSMLRHAHQLADGLDDEDHAAAVAWNAFGFMWTLNEIQNGNLPATLAKGILHEETIKDLQVRFGPIPAEFYKLFERKIIPDDEDSALDARDKVQTEIAKAEEERKTAQRCHEVLFGRKPFEHQPSSVDRFLTKSEMVPDPDTLPNRRFKATKRLTEDGSVTTTYEETTHD